MPHLPQISLNFQTAIATRERKELGKSSQADPAQRQQAPALAAEPAFPTREGTQPEGVPDLRLHEADVTFSPSLRSSPLTRRSLPSAQLPLLARLSTGSPPVPHGSAALPPHQDTQRDRLAQYPARYGVPVPVPPPRPASSLRTPAHETRRRDRDAAASPHPGLPPGAASPGRPAGLPGEPGPRARHRPG